MHKNVLHRLGGKSIRVIKMHILKMCANVYITQSEKKPKFQLLFAKFHLLFAKFQLLFAKDSQTAWSPFRLTQFHGSQYNRQVQVLWKGARSSWLFAAFHCLLEWVYFGAGTWLVLGVTLRSTMSCTSHTKNTIIIWLLIIIIIILIILMIFKWHYYCYYYTKVPPLGVNPKCLLKLQTQSLLLMTTT